MAKDGRILIYFDELVTMLAKTYSATMNTHIYSPREILSSIQGLKPVDAEEVVRCKDCKHMEVTPDCLRWCPVWNGINGMGDEGFCNYGERKNNERKTD